MNRHSSSSLTTTHNTHDTYTERDTISDVADHWPFDFIAYQPEAVLADD